MKRCSAPWNTPNATVGASSLASKVLQISVHRLTISALLRGRNALVPPTNPGIGVRLSALLDVAIPAVFCAGEPDGVLARRSDTGDFHFLSAGNGNCPAARRFSGPLGGAGFRGVFCGVDCWFARRPLSDRHTRHRCSWPVRAVAVLEPWAWFSERFSGHPHWRNRGIRPDRSWPVPDSAAYRRDGLSVQAGCSILKNSHLEPVRVLPERTIRS